jgi:hypothetical protein
MPKNINEIILEIFNDINIDEIISEVTNNISTSDFFLFENITNDNLLKIENYFSFIKRDLFKDKNKIKEHIKNISNIIKDFTGVNHIDFELEFNKDISNAMIGPYYSFKGLFLDFFPKIYNNKLEEIPKLDRNIDGLFILFTSKIIKELNEKQLMSVLLHEMGHVYTWPSGLRYLFLFSVKCLDKLSKVGGGIYLKVSGFSGIPFLFLAIIIFLIISLITSKTENLFDHKDEYKADNFAAQYGYGKHLLNALQILNKQSIDVKKKLSFIDKFKIFFNNYFNSGDTHPNFNNRTETILNNIKKEYCDRYDDFGKSYVIKQMAAIETNPSKLKNILSNSKGEEFLNKT